MCEDFTGRRLAAGQRVAYPIRQGSQIWLNSARIEHISEGRDSEGNATFTIHARNPAGRGVKLVDPSRLVILPEGTPR